MPLPLVRAEIDFLNAVSAAPGFGRGCMGVIILTASITDLTLLVTPIPEVLTPNLNITENERLVFPPHPAVIPVHRVPSVRPKSEPTKAVRRSVQFDDENINKSKRASAGTEYSRGADQMRQEARRANGAPKAQKILGTQEVYDPAEESMTFEEVVKHRREKTRARLAVRLQALQHQQKHNRQPSGEQSQMESITVWMDTTPEKRRDSAGSTPRRSADRHDVSPVRRLFSGGSNRSGRQPPPAFDFPMTPLGPDASAMNPFASLLTVPAKFTEERRKAHDDMQRELWDRFRRRKSGVSAEDVARDVLEDLHEMNGDADDLMQDFELTGQLDGRVLREAYAVRFLERCEEEGW